MFKCARCNSEGLDGVLCSGCKLKFDFPCSGITKAGYNKLGGDRQLQWKCASCKTGFIPTPPGSVPASSSPTPVSMDLLLAEIQGIKMDLAPLRSMSDDIKSLKSDVSDLKNSLEMAHSLINDFTQKIHKLESRLDTLEKTNLETATIHNKIDHLEQKLNEKEQWSRRNNIEIKGVPLFKSENLIDTIVNLSKKINYPITPNQINFVARVPSRINNNSKPIAASFHNYHLKEEFMLAARRLKSLSSKDLGYSDDKRIFVNDHLTVSNKMLLTKVKALAKEKHFLYVWVKHSKILVRKNNTSPITAIYSERDLINIQ
ncbi:uncharacterized protein LOC143914110 [Arctopsyche grandis]|uniref:uncharacterized protein LOC143914110 n=1 Tax=Arctopsyche grandis TaxID=121162 RepID=UPI00406D7403